jgi:hypothetical protein
MNFNNLAQGKHYSHITERSMEQEDECHKIRSTLTPWKKVNKSPPSPFKTMKGAQGLSRMSRLGEQKDDQIKEGVQQKGQAK